jgi:hypothetical protein
MSKSRYESLFKQQVLQTQKALTTKEMYYNTQ